MRHAVSLTFGAIRPLLALQAESGTCLAARQCRLYATSLIRERAYSGSLTSTSSIRQSLIAWQCSQQTQRPACRTYSVTQPARKQKSTQEPSVAPQLATTPESSEQTERTLTWRDYDPEGGLPLPEGDLPPTKLNEVFSSSIDPETGNWIIRLMNWRRHSGSLIDQGITFDPSLDISPEQAFAALQYLRRHDPDFDENAAGISWAEEQIQELTAPYIARAEKLGLYKRLESDEEASASPYSESQLVAMKRSNEARFAAEEAAKAAQQKADDEAAIAAAQALPHSPSDGPGPFSTALSPAAAARATLARRDRAAWVKHYEERATLSTAKEAPTMSAWSRIGPSLALTVAVLAGALLLHEGYVAPPDSARLWPEVSAATATLAALVGAQVLVFVAYRFPPLWRVGNKFLLVVPAAPRAAGVVLATFTHTQFAHFFWNAVLLCAFGRFLHDDVGRGTLLAIFLATGTAANFASLATHVLRRDWSVYIYGSSTAVYGVLTAACLLRADHDVTFLGYQIPMTGLVFLGIVVGLDLLAFLRGGAVGAAVNFSGHLAGFVGGALCAAGIRWEQKATDGAEGDAEDAESMQFTRAP